MLTGAPSTSIAGKPVPTPQPWSLLPLGEVEYGEAWDLQQRLVAARQQELIGDVLVLLQHPPTYTMGRRATPDHVLLNEVELAQRGVAVHYVDRGGDVTYHGPGQLVGYPIIDLRKRGLDVHEYLRSLEEVLIRALRSFGVIGERDPQYTGVWVGGEKMAAIGVKVSRGVTSHGFALNVSTDLSYFDGIVPCGITDRSVTSLAQFTYGPPIDREVREAVVKGFMAVFGRTWKPTNLDALLSVAPIVNA